jgi:lipopolysaccharide export system permease protein
VRTIDRYILQELGAPFAQSLGALTFILLTREILRLVELLINKGVGLVPLLKTFLLLLPSFFVLTLPMACLIASISAFSRLSSDRELTAMQATGVSMGRLLRPVLLFSAAVFLVTLYLSQYAQPWTGQSIKKLALIMLRDEVSMAFDEGVFNTPTDKVVMYIGERSLPNGPHGVFISDARIKGEPRIIVAHDWAAINDPLHNRVGMTLRDGTIHVNPKDPREYRMIMFTRYDFTLNLSESLSPTPEERLSLQHIRDKITETNGEDPRYLRMLQDHYKNLAVPVSTLLFGIIGMPLGIIIKRSGRSGGFAVGILVVLLFYVLNVIADYWVSSRVLTPFAAAWFPNAVFSAACVWLFYSRARA